MRHPSFVSIWNDRVAHVGRIGFPTIYGQARSGLTARVLATCTARRVCSGGIPPRGLAGKNDVHATGRFRRPASDRAEKQPSVQSGRQAGHMPPVLPFSSIPQVLSGRNTTIAKPGVPAKAGIPTGNSRATAPVRFSPAATANSRFPCPHKPTRPPPYKRDR